MVSSSARLGRRVLYWIIVAGVSGVVGLALAVVKIPLIVGAIIAGLMAFFVVRHPYVGLLAYLMIFSLRLAELFPVLAPLRPERTIGMITFGLLLLAQIRRHGGITFDRSKPTLHFYFLILAAFLTVP